ncbi:hypothetical protein [Bacillus sp. AK031]
MNIEEYKKYRQVQVHINTNIIDSVPAQHILKAAEILIMRMNGKVSVPTNLKSDFLWEFLIHEKFTDQKPIIFDENYTDSFNEETQKEVIEAVRNSFTSLYSIHSIDIENHLIYLEDIYQSSSGIIPVTDIGLSHSLAKLKTGLLLFVRIIPFDKFNMLEAMKKYNH